MTDSIEFSKEEVDRAILITNTGWDLFKSEHPHVAMTVENLIDMSIPIIKPDPEIVFEDAILKSAAELESVIGRELKPWVLLLTRERLVFELGKVI